MSADRGQFSGYTWSELSLQAVLVSRPGLLLQIITIQVPYDAELAMVCHARDQCFWQAEIAKHFIYARQKI